MSLLRCQPQWRVGFRSEQITLLQSADGAVELTIAGTRDDLLTSVYLCGGANDGSVAHGCNREASPQDGLRAGDFKALLPAAKALSGRGERLHRCSAKSYGKMVKTFGKTAQHCLGAAGRKVLLHGGHLLMTGIDTIGRGSCQPLLDGKEVMAALCQGVARLDTLYLGGKILKLACGQRAASLN